MNQGTLVFFLDQRTVPVIPNYRVLPIDEPDSLLTGTEQKQRYAIRSSMRLMERHARGVSEYAASASTR